MSAKALLSASVSAPPAAYVEDVFSTYLYTGNGTIQTITNGIDLSGEGGMVWIKGRGAFSENHNLIDTARGITKSVSSNNDSSELTNSNDFSSFNANGFSLGAVTAIEINGTARPYCSWTFRKEPKFFDVVTWTGDGTSSRNIAHSLGSTPGFIVIKRTSATADWWCWHRSISTGNLSGNDLIVLNSTAAKTAGIGTVIGTASSATFEVGGDSSVNASGATYVAYLFAHDAGGFGTAGTDNVVSCGSYTGNGSATGPIVNFGWEPQWLLIKRTDAAYDWWLSDNMRGMTVGGDDRPLLPNTADQEQSFDWMSPTATGFQLTTSNINFNASGGTYIYIAIRRGPMKTPTVGTEVFSMDTLGGTAPNPPGFNSGFPVDLGFYKGKAAGADWAWADRLRGAVQLSSASTAAEVSNAENMFDYMNGWNTSTAVSSTYPGWMFRRAPGFFDVVAYTGTFSVLNVSHNLTVAPQLMIIKQRSAVRNWIVYSAGVAAPATSILRLNTTDAVITGVTNHWNSTAPTSSVFTVANDTDVNDSGGTYIAYLFATLTGISKVGTYTGTGTTKQIDCGFTAGARFVLIKRTDSTGDWYVWDTARGIISGNDPYLLLNSTAAEVTNTDYIDPLSSGFEISSTAPAAINANGGSYIFLSIA